MNKSIIIKLQILIGLSIVLLIPQYYSWMGAPGDRTVAIDAIGWFAGCLVISSVLRAVAPRWAYTALLAFIVAWLIVAVGWVESLVVGCSIASAWSIGAFLLRWCRHKTSAVPVNSTEAVLLGTVAWLAVWGVLIHFPVNYPAVYLGLCLLSLLALVRVSAATAPDLRAHAVALRAWMESIPFWAWASGLALVGWTLRWASLPSVFYDDQAYHLRLWTELLTQQRALFDVSGQIWSVAPFAVDLLHAGVSLMAAADARGAMNLALGTMLLALVARVLHRLGYPAWVQWLMVVLMASTPMLGNLLLSLQAELLLAVVGLAGLRLVIDAQGGWRGTHVLGVLACSAMCAAIKLPGAVLGVALLAALAVRWWTLRGSAPVPSQHLRWTAWLMLVPLAFVALHSYGLAWQVTGNPVFPLYNGIFRSPLIPAANFSDTRWVRGFSLVNYFRVFFHTSEFFEGNKYTAGWQYLFFLPFALAALWRRNVPTGLRIALVPMLGFGLVMFHVTQYWRYMFPVMPMAAIVLAALFFWNGGYGRKLAVFGAITCIVANVLFFPKVSWVMMSAAQPAYTSAGKDQLLRRYAPAASLTQEVNRLAPGSRVFYPAEAPHGATLNGSPLYVTWYAPSPEKRFLALKTMPEIKSFFDDEKVDFAIASTTPPPLHDQPLELLREHLALYGTAVAWVENYILYRLNDTALAYRKLFDLRATESGRKGPTAVPEPRVLAEFDTGRASQLRYSVRFTCPEEQGFFVAQVNWDKGDPYYRLVACRAADISFAEAAPIPAGARRGFIYLTARDTPSVQVEDLAVEVY